MKKTVEQKRQSVLDFLNANQGSTAADIARHCEEDVGTISARLNRMKNWNHVEHDPAKSRHGVWRALVEKTFSDDEIQILKHRRKAIIGTESKPEPWRRFRIGGVDETGEVCRPISGGGQGAIQHGPRRGCSLS